MKCLIAEDDITSRVLLQQFLSRYGSCDVVGDGRAAVEAVSKARASRSSYDLICMDLRMPGMGGQDAIREIRKEERACGLLRSAKIVVTTSLTDMKSITNALLGKCNAYIP